MHLRSPIAALAVCAITLFLAAPCYAHPIKVGIGTQSWIFCNGSNVSVIFNAGYSIFTASVEMDCADKDDDKKLSHAEILAFRDRVRRSVVTGLEMAIDGKPVTLCYANAWHTTLRPGDIVLEPIDFWFRFDVKCPRLTNKLHCLRYRDRTFPVDRRQCLIFVPQHPAFRFSSIPRALGSGSPALLRGSEFAIACEHVEFEFKLIDADAGKPLFFNSPYVIPKEILPEYENTARAKPTEISSTQSDQRDKRDTAQRLLEDWLNVNSYGVFIIGLILTALWGAWHAFTPGHGKSMVAAYLIGSKGRMRDAFFLGTTVTITHTGTIFITVTLVLIAQKYFDDPTGTRTHNTVMLVTGLVSGGILWWMGAFLFYRRWGRKSGSAHAHDSAHTHEHTYPDGAAHSHEHPNAGHGHSHSHDGLDEDAHARAHAGSVSRWTLLTLGVSGGIVPCPAAITIFIFSMGHLENLRLGLAFLISFSVGLGFVLTGIGVALILSKNILAGTLKESRLFQTIPGFRNRFGAALDRAAFATGRRLPGLSAIFIMLLGNYMLLNTLFVMGAFGS